MSRRLKRHVCLCALRYRRAGTVRNTGSYSPFVVEIYLTTVSVASFVAGIVNDSSNSVTNFSTKKIN